MRISRLLIVAGSLLALAGCTCDKKTAPVSKKKVLDKKSKQGAKPLPSLKDQMRKMQFLAAELRRRVPANLSAAGPAKGIRDTLKKLPVERYPKSFKIFYNSMVVRTEALIVTKDLGPDYDKFVDRCIACHALHAEDHIGIVKRLKVPKDKWPKPQPVKKGSKDKPPAGKRPGPTAP